MGSDPRLEPNQSDLTRLGPRGIGGWLAFFVVSQLISVALTLANVIGNLDAFSGDAWALGDQVPIYRPLLIVETVAQVALVALIAVGLTLTFKLHPSTKTFYTRFLLGVFIYAVIEFAGLKLLYGQMTDLVVSAGQPTTELEESGSKATVATLRLALYSLIWLAYWKQSVRVANTFPPREGPSLPATRS